MAATPLDVLDDATAWSVTGAGVSIVGSDDAPHPGRVGLAVVADAAAVGTFAETTTAAVDLRPVDDLQLWVRGQRPAAGRGSYLIELALGAADLGIDAATNRWRRFLPVEQPGRWEPVVVSVADLPAKVRRAASVVRLTVVAEEPFRLELAAASAVRVELITDVEAALIARLDGAATIGATPVPAVVAPDLPAGGAGQPHLRLRPVAVRPAPELGRMVPERTDHVASGFSLRPPAEPYELDYGVDVVAGTRAAQATMVEAVLDAVPNLGPLLVNDRPALLEWIGALGPTGDPPVPSAPIRVTAARPARVDAAPAVPPFNEVRVEVEPRG